MTRLPRLIGRGRALEVLLSSDDLTGAQAEAYGYANRALPDAQLDQFVRLWRPAYQVRHDSRSHRLLLGTREIIRAKQNLQGASAADEPGQACHRASATTSPHPLPTAIGVSFTADKTHIAVGSGCGTGRWRRPSDTLAPAHRPRTRPGFCLARMISRAPKRSLWLRESCLT